MKLLGFDTIFGAKNTKRPTQNRSVIAQEAAARKASVDNRFKTPAWEFDRRKAARWEFEVRDNDSSNKVA